MIFQNEETFFQAIKTRILKSRKIDIFLKRLTHGFGRKMAIFPTFFFFFIAYENVFYDILERKNAFLGYKNKKFKKSKIDIFLKRLTHGFGRKMAIFPTFFFFLQPMKMSFMIFYNEKTFFQAIKTRSLKSRKTDISLQGLTHGFGSKIALFDLFLLGNITQENVCYDILERKNAFLGYKNKKSKKSENRHFSKEVIPGFWFINGKFLNFFFGNKGHGNVFYDIVERQNAFLGNKNKKFKTSKIDIFLKWLTHDFGPKMVVFSSFFFRQYRPGKCFL